MTAQRFEIRVRGSLAPWARSRLEEFDVGCDGGGGTTVSGTVPDDAALRALLDELRDSGVELVDLRRLSA